jgi:hypothetical protein
MASFATRKDMEPVTYKDNPEVNAAEAVAKTLTMSDLLQAANELGLRGIRVKGIYYADGEWMLKQDNPWKWGRRSGWTIRARARGMKAWIAARLLAWGARLAK